MMTSAVCLGGHWKRMDKILGEKAEGEGWFAVQDVTVVTGDGPPTFAN